MSILGFWVWFSLLTTCIIAKVRYLTDEILTLFVSVTNFIITLTIQRCGTSGCLQKTKKSSCELYYIHIRNNYLLILLLYNCLYFIKIPNILYFVNN